jgi:hypothetical protein
MKSQEINFHLWLFFSFSILHSSIGRQQQQQLRAKKAKQTLVKFNDAEKQCRREVKKRVEKKLMEMHG